MLLKVLVLALLSSTSVLAEPLERRANPKVTIKNGTITGGQNGLIEYFNQIPYAQPPIDSLRLRPPQPISKAYGTLDATVLGARSCPQFYFDTNDLSDLPSSAYGALLNSPFFQLVTNTGEDCLNLNIVRPAGLSSTAKVPVVVWIYGGGFQFGSTQSYKADSLVTRSIALKAPIIYVAMNYRVGGFGFLPGKQLSAEKSTNLGLRDQRMALQWVQENIAAFGGDPDKVTIWGESAGAVSVLDQMLINGGDNKYNGKALFRAAILNSGSESETANMTDPKAQSVFDQVSEAAGCKNDSAPVDCLRKKDYTSLLNAMNSVPSFLGYRSLDLSYLPRPDTSDGFFPLDADTAIYQGKYTRVPVIIGNQEDEGTVFALAQKNITTATQLDDYFTSFLPGASSSTTARNVVTGFTQTYPDDGGVSGSPFNTSTDNNFYPQYKRLAAISGDMSFALTRRMLLSTIASTQPCWSYQGSYLHGTPLLGTFHASDVPYMFGSYGENVPTASLQTYIIAFVTGLDPNALGNLAPVVKWPQWTRGNQVLMNLGATGNEVLQDSFRNESYNYLLNLKAQIRGSQAPDGRGGNGGGGGGGQGGHNPTKPSAASVTRAGSLSLLVQCVVVPLVLLLDSGFGFC